MAGSSSNQDVFDVRKIRRLIELMKEHDLAEMDLRQGDMRIQLRREVQIPNPKSQIPNPISKQAPSAPAATPPDEEYIAAIETPVVGTFYAAPAPDAPPYVKVGDHVGPDTTVCIVEAMKVFNEIQAEVAGKIVAVLVENGEPVEFGQPLFKVDTRQ